MRTSFRVVLGLVWVMGVGVGGRAFASGWHLAGSAATTFPTDIGGRLDLETPGRLLISSQVGYLPHAYFSLINNTVQDLGGYDRQTADLVDAITQGGWVWRSHLGWRPFKRAGFFFQVGYSRLELKGSLEDSEALANAVGEPSLQARNFSATAHATLHQVDGQIGWRWVIAERLFIRAAVGGFFTFSSSSNITTRSSAADRPYALILTQKGEAYLNDTFKSYAHSPTASLAIGYQFF